MANVVKLPPRQLIERLTTAGFLQESKPRQNAAIKDALEDLRASSKLFFLTMETTA